MQRLGQRVEYVGRVAHPAALAARFGKNFVEGSPEAERAADIRGERRTNGGTSAELNFTPAPERSRTFGTLTSTLPTDVSTSRAGR